METTLRIAPPRHRLIINADDLGVSPERDAGIFECFAAGAITSASLLVDGIDAAAAVRRALECDLPLGLHLNLTEYALATPCSLTDAQGRRLGKIGLRQALAAGRVATADIEAEIRHQFERFIALTGELPSHVDGHHHIHVEAAIAAPLARIMAREYGVHCVRLPRERGLADKTADADFDADFQRGVMHAATVADAAFADQGIYATAAFLGQSLMGHRLQAATMRGALAALAADAVGSVELMVHPGISGDIAGGDPARCDFCKSPARDHERQALQTAAWQEALAGWQRCSYRELPRPDDAGDSRPTILIYGKLTPATGNAETARRYEAAWSSLANVRFRALLPLETPAALARETRRLRETAAREHLDFAFGIHLRRAGGPLAAAFAAGDASPDCVPLPYGLLASGTDANADIDSPEKRAIIAAALRHAEFLCCLTDDMLRRLDGLPLPPATRVLPNGIEVRTASGFSLRQALSVDAQAALILLPAALRRLKGVLPTLAALAPLLATRYPQHVLVVMGPVLEADHADEVRCRIDQLVAAHPSLAGRLRLHPGLPRDDYLAALREAALVINASEHEGLSHAIAEAMAAGVPVLARDIPGNRALVHDGDNGRLFADFTALPERYGDCFDNAAATVRMVASARGDIGRRYPAGAEQRVLQEMLGSTLDRRQVPLGDLRLDLAAGTHPVSAENLALFAALVPSPQLPVEIALACDVGCGCGVLGLSLLQSLTASGRHVRHMLFTDPHRASLAALARTLTRHARQLALLDDATLDDGSLLEPLLRQNVRAHLICANLPQTPGPRGFQLDRCGGDDGAGLICAFLAELPRALATDGEAFLLHIGLAHPARVATAIAAAGFTATEIAAQTRRARLADYEALQPGLAAWLLAERAAGRAEFISDAQGDGFSFRAHLLQLRHAAV